MRLYVGNIPSSFGETQLREVFSRYGRVTSCVMPSDPKTGRYRGFGFVEMSSEAAASAMAGIDSQKFGGRRLRVREARPRKAKPARREFVIPATVRSVAAVGTVSAAPHTRRDVHKAGNPLCPCISCARRGKGPAAGGAYRTGGRPGKGRARFVPRG